MKNLVYFSPGLNRPIGGIKVIHRHSELLNSIGISSEVFYSHGPDHKVDWFDHNCRLKSSPSFSKNDIAILPESQLFHFWKKLQDISVPYGIFVQNGYLMSPALLPNDLEECYRGAKFILCISEDARRCVEKLFPSLSDKIIRVIYSVDTELFRASRKEKIVTYMPRKMKDHSDIFISFMNLRMPIGWSLQPIDNLNERGVAELLGRSSIFAAFSSFEGLPVPPVEAALSGNFVIGYTGQGGREYWNQPIFEAVEQGDIVGLVDSVLYKIQEIDCFGKQVSENSLTLLKSYFSKDAERVMLKQAVDCIYGLCAV